MSDPCCAPGDSVRNDEATAHDGGAVRLWRVCELRRHPLWQRVRIRRQYSTRAVVSVVCAVVLVAASGCGVGDDAVSQGKTFQFVSPGGKTVITYDPPATRTPVAALTGPHLFTDQPIGLAGMLGQVVVVNVWGSWCAPCRSEVDELETAYVQTKPLGVAFLGIDFRDDRQTARDFVRDRAVSYPSIYDYAGRTLAALTTPTSVVPTTVVLDRAHRPAAVFLRAITSDELGAIVRRIAAEPRV